MSKHLHNSDELLHGPEYGWQQMELLLDKNMPEQKNKSAWKLFLPYVIAASFITIFLLSSLVIQNVDHPVSFKRAVSLTGINTNDAPRPGIGSRGLRLAEIVIPTVRKEQLYHSEDSKLKTIAGQTSAETIGAGSSPGWILAASKRIAAERITSTLAVGALTKPFIKNREVNQLLADAVKPLPADTANKISKQTKSPKQTSWGLSAGIGVNAMLDQQQNLRPYPVAELRYNMSKKSFLTLGLAAGSGVATHSKGTDKTVFVNDTSNNIYYYNNVRHYTRLTYADLPLMAGIHISKKVALQAGVQASVLLNTKTTTSIEPYDFQRVLATGVPVNLVPALTAGAGNEFEVKARKIDYRITAGVKYTIKNASFNVSYQYAPQRVLTGDNVSKHKNQLLSFNALFKIK